MCTEPVILVEVLSPSTEQIDRREKLFAYQEISTLREYVLVAQDRMLVEVYRRQESGEWEIEKLSSEDELLLSSIGFTLPVADIYRGVRFDSQISNAFDCLTFCWYGSVDSGRSIDGIMSKIPTRRPGRYWARR